MPIDLNELRSVGNVSNFACDLDANNSDVVFNLLSEYLDDVISVVDETTKRKIEENRKTDPCVITVAVVTDSDVNDPHVDIIIGSERDYNGYMDSEGSFRVDIPSEIISTYIADGLKDFIDSIGNIYADYEGYALEYDDYIQYSHIFYSINISFLEETEELDLSWIEDEDTRWKWENISANGNREIIEKYLTHVDDMALDIKDLFFAGSMSKDKIMLSAFFYYQENVWRMAYSAYSDNNKRRREYPDLDYRFTMGSPCDDVSAIDFINVLISTLKFYSLALTTGHMTAAEKDWIFHNTRYQCGESAWYKVEII